MSDFFNMIWPTINSSLSKLLNWTSKLEIHFLNSELSWSILSPSLVSPAFHSAQLCFYDVFGSNRTPPYKQYRKVNEANLMTNMTKGRVWNHFMIFEIIQFEKRCHKWFWIKVKIMPLFATGEHLPNLSSEKIFMISLACLSLSTTARRTIQTRTTSYLGCPLFNRLTTFLLK